MKKNLAALLVLGLLCLTVNSGRAFFEQHSKLENEAPGPQQVNPENPGEPNLLVDAQSTTGPTPPPGVQVKTTLLPSPKAVILSGVPTYLWHDGCGPTAVGMVFGYWDSHGYDWMIPGSAITQTAQVDEAISSSLGMSNHLMDYAEPKDYAPNPLIADLSEPWGTSGRPDDSIADFMRTSRSFYSNYYGWSWFSDVKRSFLGYFDRVNPPSYYAISTNLYYTDLWENFIAEINAGRPMVFLVDTSGDSSTDHFVTAIGYDVVGDVKMYAALNNWVSGVQWYAFKPLGYGNFWGIFGGTTFKITLLEKALYLPNVKK